MFVGVALFNISPMSAKSNLKRLGSGDYLNPFSL
jgi:hypothetical protein